MSRFRRTALAAALMGCFLPAPAWAADELALYVFQDGRPATALTVVLDGGAPVPLGADGSVRLDLSGGAHSIQLRAGDQVLHSFRFEAAAGQKVDITASLSAAGAPEVKVDPYFDNASVAERAAARSGAVTGVVSLDGTPLAGAQVTVRGSSVGATTDADGRYTLQLPRGSYPLDVRHPSLGDASVTSTVRVVGGIEVVQSFARVRDGAVADTTVVERIVIPVRRLPALEEEQFATGVIDTINAAELSRFGGSDVAASVVRVPSITVQENKYVFIRGLGDRYVTTTLNGATLPSTDPSRRTVPLDLFPSNLVSQLVVRKSFEATMPGESTGGNLQITTQSLPATAGGKLSATLGFNTSLTGDDIYADPTRGDYDYFGFDDGSRRENGLLPLISDALQSSDEFSESARIELQQIGGLLLRDDLDLRTTTAAPKGSLGLNYGDVFDLGDGRRAGYFVAGNFSNNTTERDDGVSRTYGSEGSLLDDFRFVETTRNVDTSGLLALGYSQGEHSFASNTLLSRATESSVRVSAGRDGDEREESYRYSIDWVERQFVSQQFSGEHRLGGTLAKWQVSASQAARYAPDRREVRFDLEGGDGIYNLQVPALLRRFDDLTDDNIDISTDWETKLGGGQLKYGLQLIRRERDSDSASYGYTGGQSLDDNAPNRLVADVITPETITGDTDTGYAFLDETLPSDSYDAELRQYAGYLSYDIILGDFQVVAGSRYETYEQTTETFGLQGTAEAVRSVIDETSFLPALSLNWFIDDQQQLRFGVSRTVARPDFKESSNATFYDTEFDFRVRGNPLLRPSDITNFDLRYERYTGDTSNASVALFYKDLKDPIERVVQPASGTAGNSRTYQNATQARIYGIEVDGRREFPLDAELTRSFFVAFNGSVIESEVELAGGGKRQLQGQPRYTANLIVGFDDIATGHELTLLLNQNGKSIQDVGVNDLPDVIEEPRLSLNLNYRYKFAPRLEFRLKASNLLNSDVEFTQGGQVFQSYRRGTEIEAGIDWRF